MPTYLLSPQFGQGYVQKIPLRDDLCLYILGDDYTPSLEKLAALKPDLILGEASRNADKYDLLSQIAPTILWGDRLIQGQWRKSLRDLAAVLGQDKKAEDIIQQYEANIANVQADLADVVAAHPKLLLFAAHRLEEAIYVIKPDSYLGDLLGRVGFQLAPQPAANINSVAPISIEALPTLDQTDTIIILSYNINVSDEQLENSDPLRIRQWKIGLQRTR